MIMVKQELFFDMVFEYDIEVPAIRGFQGEYRFLSNFFDSRIEYPMNPDGDDIAVFFTAEHMYQAFKSLDPEYQQMVLEAPTAGKAKRLGKECVLRSDWENVKMGIMFNTVYHKFAQNAELKAKLLATGYAYLEETNHWGDKIWGVCDGVGTNWLGKMLMLVRTELRS